MRHGSWVIKQNERQKRELQDLQQNIHNEIKKKEANAEDLEKFNVDNIAEDIPTYIKRRKDTVNRIDEDR